MIRSIKFFALCGTLLLLVSCAKKMTEVQKEKLPRRKTQDLIEVMDSLSHRKPNFFYTKISTDFADTNRSISFKTSIRMVKDSAINTLITYAKIPVVNSIITKDTVTIVNKRDKCYIIQSLSYIKDNFGIDFNYTISSHKKREIRRRERIDRHEPEKDDIIIKYYLSDDAHGLKGMYIESPADSTTIKVDYLTREMMQNYNIPKNVYIEITSPRNQMRITLDYDKAEIDQPQPLFLVIPEGYEKCE